MINYQRERIELWQTTVLKYIKMTVWQCYMIFTYGLEEIQTQTHIPVTECSLYLWASCHFMQSHVFCKRKQLWLSASTMQPKNSHKCLWQIVFSFGCTNTVGQPNLALVEETKQSVTDTDRSTATGDRSCNRVAVRQWCSPCYDHSTNVASQWFSKR